MIPAVYSPSRTKLLLRLRRALVRGFMKDGSPVEWAQHKATQVIVSNKHKIQTRSKLRDIVAALEIAAGS